MKKSATAPRKYSARRLYVKLYEDWHERTGQPEPTGLARNDCYMRGRIILQLIYLFFHHQVAETTVRIWWLVGVGAFVVMSILATDLMAFIAALIIALVIILIVASFVALVLIILEKTGILTVFEVLFEPVVDFAKRLLQRFNVWLWNVRIRGFQIAWIVIPIAILTIQLPLIGYLASQPPFSLLWIVAAVISWVLALLEFLTALAWVAAIGMAVHEKVEEKQEQRKRAHNHVATTQGDSEVERLDSFHRLLFETGICRPFEIVE
jgi:hypothetical protein